MTLRLSIARERHRLYPADPVRTSCAHPPSARKTPAIEPNRTALPGSSNETAPVSGTVRTFSRTPDAPVAPTFDALSP